MEVTREIKRLYFERCFDSLRQIVEITSKNVFFNVYLMHSAIPRIHRARGRVVFMSTSISLARNAHKVRHEEAKSSRTGQLQLYNILSFYAFQLGLTLGHPCAVYAFGVKQSSCLSICYCNTRSDLLEAKSRQLVLFATVLAFGVCLSIRSDARKNELARFFFKPQTVRVRVAHVAARFTLRLAFFLVINSNMEGHD